MLATISGDVYTLPGCKVLALYSGRLFVACGVLRIYDGSNPATPVQLG